MGVKREKLMMPNSWLKAEWWMHAVGLALGATDEYDDSARILVSGLEYFNLR